MWSQKLLSTLAAATMLAAVGCDGQAGHTATQKPSGQPAVQQLGNVGTFSAVSTKVSYPAHIAIAADGTVFTADVGANLVFGVKDGVRTVEISNLAKPLGIAVAGNLLYVGVQGRGTVEVYDLTAKKAVQVLNAKFKMPNSIAVASDGTVYVADSLANNVQVFGKDGAAVTELTGFNFPAAVAVNDANVVVGDQGNHRVVVFGRDNKLVKAFGQAVDEKITAVQDFKGRFTRIQDIALKGNDVLVLDSYHAHVQQLGLDGVSKGFMGRAGLGLALGIGIDSAGNLLASDPQNKRLVAIPQELR